VEKILKRAEDEWRSDVEEPKGLNWERISTYIWKGLGWDWVPKYTKDGQFAWCGAFAAWCFAAAGLGAEICKTHMPSTYRLYRWANRNERLLAPEKILPGDLAIVGPENAKVWGNHITVVYGTGPNGVLTYEGNARGEGPQANEREGVIRTYRPFQHSKSRVYRVLYGIRPLDTDYS
jgi:hypothetical protein